MGGAGGPVVLDSRTLRYTTCKCVCMCDACVCVCLCVSMSVCDHMSSSLLTQYDEEAEHRKATATKRRKLDAMEEQWRVGHNCTCTYPTTGCVTILTFSQH